MRASQLPDQPATAPAQAPEVPASAPGQPREITLSDGRKVAMVKPKGAYSLRIFEWLGPQNSANEMLIVHYRAILHVSKIDGQDEATPQTRLQLEALAQRLGDDALDAIAACYLEHFVAGSTGIRPL